MHADHDVFLEGIERSRKVDLTFFCGKRGRRVATRCAPLHFGKGRVAGDRLECYYFWDFSAESGGGFLSLPTSAIVAIESTDEGFHVHEVADLSEARRRSRRSGAT